MSELQKITQEQMDAVGVVSAPDVLSGTPSENKSIFDKMVRQLIAPAYNQAVDAIEEINETETGIQAAEELRVQAEEDRRENEDGRVSAEELRMSAEETRTANEEGRVAGEAVRVEAELLRVQAETARSAAEQERTSAEEERDTAEAEREAAEALRESTTNGIVVQATQQASAAAASAQSAQSDASAAGSSAQQAASAQSAAAESAGNAAESAGLAAESASAAQSDAASASQSASSAAASKTAAAASAAEASASETAAAASNTQAQAAAERAEQAAADAEAIAGGDYITSNQKGIPGGVASLDETGKVPAGQLPEMDYDQAGSADAVRQSLDSHTSNTSNPHSVTAGQVGAIPNTQKGVANGVASLGADGKVPAGQLPEMDYIATDQKGVAGGVAELDDTGKIPEDQIPPLLRMVDFSEEDWTAGGIGYTLTIAQSQHGCTSGEFLTAIWHLVNGDYRRNTWAAFTTEVSYDSTTGNVVLDSEISFDGKISFMGCRASAGGSAVADK